VDGAIPQSFVLGGDAHLASKLEMCGCLTLFAKTSRK
jgi:hypothetical protein